MLVCTKVHSNSINLISSQFISIQLSWQLNLICEWSCVSILIKFHFESIAINSTWDKKLFLSILKFIFEILALSTSNNYKNSIPKKLRKIDSKKSKKVARRMKKNENEREREKKKVKTAYTDTTPKDFAICATDTLIKPRVLSPMPIFSL